MFDRILDPPVGQRHLLYGGPHAYAQEAEGEPYCYNPTEKRDSLPFPARTAQKQAVVREAKTLLQRFDLGQLKLVRIIWEARQPKALIEDRGGLGYIVEAGTLIGSDGGVIKLIEARGVVVEKFETDFYGKRQVKQREPQLMIVNSTPHGGGTNAKE